MGVCLNITLVPRRLCFVGLLLLSVSSITQDNCGRFLVSWCLSGGTLVSITKVTLCWVWLVLGWMTVFGRANHLSIYT